MGMEYWKAKRNLQSSRYKGDADVADFILLRSNQILQLEVSPKEIKATIASVEIMRDCDDAKQPSRQDMAGAMPGL